MIGRNLRRAFAFLDPVEAVDARQIHVFDGPAGPMDFHILYFVLLPNPKCTRKSFDEA